MSKLQFLSPPAMVATALRRPLSSSLQSSVAAARLYQSNTGLSRPRNSTEARTPCSNSPLLVQVPIVNQARSLTTTTPLPRPDSTTPKDPLFSVSHITALVTGGGTGIGLMITQALSSAGARVYITGRRPDALSRVVDLYSKSRASGAGEIIPLPGDISQKDECLRLAEEVSGREPNGIQLLVNNAGIARDKPTSFAAQGKPDMTSPASISQHFLRSEPDDWAATFATNVTAGFFMSMAFLPVLARGHENSASAQNTAIQQGQQGGYTSSIVNVSSISGAMKGSSGGQFAYASSKAAFTHLTRMLATTFLGTGVRVNGIAPGLFPSEMTTPTTERETQKSIPDSYASSNPAGRKGTDADMAATILFLAGRGGGFYNHQILYPDGGNLVAQPAAV